MSFFPLFGKMDAGVAYKNSAFFQEADPPDFRLKNLPFLPGIAFGGSNFFTACNVLADFHPLNFPCIQAFEKRQFDFGSPILRVIG